MAPKKKKGMKKKAKKADPSIDPDAEKPIYKNEPPPYLDPVKDAPIARMKLQLAAPCHSFLTTTWEARNSTRLYMLFRQIKQLHGGAIDNIKVCNHQYFESEAVSDPSLTLRDIGVVAEGEYTILYDYTVS